MRILIIGGSKTVYFLARQLTEHHHQVTIINRDAERAKYLARRLAPVTVVHGDGSNIKILEEAGARRADLVLALTAHDQDNLVSCQIAQKLYGVPRTIALVNDPENEKIFQKLGITVAFSATRILASMIEQQASMDDIISLMPIAEGKINVIDIRLDADSPAVGKTLQELGMSDNTLIACIIRDGEAIIPRGSNYLFADDHILVISQPDSQVNDLRLLLGEPSNNGNS